MIYRINKMADSPVAVTRLHPTHPVHPVDFSRRIVAELKALFPGILPPAPADGGTGGRAFKGKL
jgi:hypothetical protein